MTSPDRITAGLRDAIAAQRASREEAQKAARDIAESRKSATAEEGMEVPES